MKCTRSLTAGASVLALAAIASLTAGAAAPSYHFPYKKGSTFRLDPNQPLVHIGPYEAAFKAPKKSKSGTWTDLTGSLPFTNGPWNPLQLTDGTVLVEDYCTSPEQWYKLTPDKTGSYVNGTWSAIATMPAGYSPLFFASQILTDGRMIVNGGEYNDCKGDWTNLGALYDPVNNSWTSVTAPTGWTSIGDAQSAILPDGSYMLADCCTKADAIATISGTNVTWTTTGTGKNDDNDEEGWTNLPGGDVFTVDVWSLCNPGDHYELYDPTTGDWTLQSSCTPDTLTITSTRELGPGPLTPAYGKQGTIIQFSADPSSGVNDIYDVAGNSWTSGPVMTYKGTIYDVADGPAVTLPNGHVLVDASPGTFETPSHFWEWSFSKKGKLTVTQVNDTNQAAGTSSFEANLMMLPTGQAIWDNSQTTPNEVAVYTETGTPNKAWAPVVSGVSNKLKIGSTGNAISGTNFNGFDLGGQYGDDSQETTNFPLVRITNTKSGDVCFGRSYDFSTMGVWTTGTTNAEFDIPKTCEKGASSLQVIVNGIASTSVSVTLS
ncbi:MAG TPA: hypothetical protein VMF67_16940 [Rhizomicrobium sp.]|nr:hypothetical protein [Rhizomicrobium sp.]